MHAVSLDKRQVAVAGQADVEIEASVLVKIDICLRPDASQTKRQRESSSDRKEASWRIGCSSSGRHPHCGAALHRTMRLMCEGQLASARAVTPIINRRVEDERVIPTTIVNAVRFRLRMLTEQICWRPARRPALSRRTE